MRLVSEILGNTFKRERVEKELIRKAEELKDINLNLTKTKEELIELNKNLENKVKERTKTINDLLEQKDEFINQLSHDLSTFITPIVGIIPLIMKDITNSDTLEALNVISNSANFMEKLVKETLELARTNTSKNLSEMEKIELFTVANYAIENNIIQIREKQIIVKNNVEKNILVKGDKLRILEVFNNLINNAIKYGPDHNEIVIDTKDYLENMVLVSIRDNGIGMEKEVLNHIFDEFYKVDKSKNSNDSFGLGLSICKRIIEKHNGQIWAESDGPGKGSNFNFTLLK
jgi:signal transduction histidine kinase